MRSSSVVFRFCLKILFKVSFFKRRRRLFYKRRGGEEFIKESTSRGVLSILFGE